MKTKFTFSMLLLALATVFQFASAATAVFNVTVPNDGGTDGHHQTNRVMMAGNFNKWNAGSGAIECTKVDNTHYTVTLDESTFADQKVTLATIQYKYLSGPDGSWAYVMKGDAPKYDELGNNSYAGTSPQVDVVLAWASVWKDVVPIPGYFTIDIYTPKTVTECYMTGNFNGWLSPGTVAKVDSTDTKMKLDPAQSDANGNYFTIKIYTSNVHALAFKFSSGPGWNNYNQTQGNLSYKDVSLTTVLFDAVGLPTANPPVAPQITFGRIYPGAVGLKTITLTATVPANTSTAYVIGSVNYAANDTIAGSKNNDGTFTFSVPKVDIFNYNYYYTTNASGIEVKADNSADTVRVADAQLKTAFTDVVAAWKTTGVKTIDVSQYKIFANNKSIVVEGVKSRVEVLSLDGRSIQSENLNGKFTSKTLNKGMYIIRVDGATRKVFVN
ncbi:MAG: hypothetical protein WCK78_10320 [Paludibacter sp.]